MTETTRIAFTSCIRYKNFPQQPQWQQIEAARPDYLFLLGDHIYMDFGLFPFSCEYNGKPSHYSPEKFQRIMRRKYQQQWSEPHFRRLIDNMRERNALFAIWDDHDFAWNNAYGNQISHTIKQISRKLFHEYLDCSSNRPEIYCHADLPLARAIFLDNRYYADPPGDNACLLGDTQWQFLTEKLNHKQPWTLLCSALSLDAGLESWSRYKSEYRRLKQLLQQHKNIVLLSGDIHRNVFKSPANGHPCHEAISSGMAVNQLGLPFGISDQVNWAQLDVSGHDIKVTLHDKHGSRIQLIERS